MCYAILDDKDIVKFIVLLFITFIVTQIVVLFLLIKILD